MSNREKTLYKILTHSFVVLVSCHLLLAMVLIFYPAKLYITDTRIEKAYRLFGLTGPFFSEDRINVVPKVYSAIKFQGEDWNQFYELGESEFTDFHKNYLRYNQLLVSGLPRYLCRQIKVKKPTENALYVQGIKNYLSNSHTATIDSAKLVYTLTALSTNKTDTLFVMPLGEFDKHDNR